MPMARAPAFLTSLREFFSRRQSRVRSRRFHRAGRQASIVSGYPDSALTRVTHHPSPVTRHFSLESLEPRLLLNAAPTVTPEASVTDAVLPEPTIAAIAPADLTLEAVVPVGTVKSNPKISNLLGLDNTDRFGLSVATIGDLNSDGVEDLAVGAPQDDDGGVDRGAVYILLMNANGTLQSSTKISSSLNLPLANGDQFGASVVWRGGSLIAVGAPSDDSLGVDSGAVWLVTLTQTGAINSAATRLTGAFVSTNVGAGDRFGLSLGAVDLNGDGVLELVVGAPLDDDGGLDRGAVYVFGQLGNRKISDLDPTFTGILDDSDNFGRSIASVGDLDNDGVGDLAIGAARDDDGGIDQGAVWVLFMNANGTVKGNAKISETSGGFTGILDPSDFFGSGVTGIGDLNGDGIEDLAVGATDDDDGSLNAGALWVLLLNSNGTVKTHQKISATFGGFTGILDSGDVFGFSVTSYRDLNGDGVRDLAVGAPFDDDGGTDRGAVWLLALNGPLAQQKISSEFGNFAGTLVDNGQFGSEVTGLGDLNNDGVEDLAVGVPLDDDGGINRGAVWILFMNANGTVASSQKISSLTGMVGLLDNADQFGSSVAGLGDLDGDGVEDLAVGAIGDDGNVTDAGAVWIVFLNANGTVKSTQKIGNTFGNLGFFDAFGDAVANIGDIDNDGRTDIAIGAPQDDDGGGGTTVERGAVYVARLNSNGTLKATPNKISFFDSLPLANNDVFGTSVAGIGDINGDGVEDLAVGAPWSGAGSLRNGTVHIIFLNNTGGRVSSLQLSEGLGGFTGVLDVGDFFGSSLGNLGDLDGDGLSDLAVGARGDDDGGTDRGALWQLSLKNDGTVKFFQKLSATSNNLLGLLSNDDQFGSAAGSLGDLNNDGIADLAVGVPFDDDGGVNRGAVYVLFNLGGQTFIVDNAGDQGDAVPGDGVALTAGGVTTLRAAIEEANALSGRDRIIFNIPGAGVKTLTPLSALPAITDALIIDGTTQPGYAGTPLIELNGTSAGASTIGLLVVSGGSGSTIKGLAINRFTSAGIWLDGNSSGNTIVSNYVGTDTTGTIDLGNAGDGIVIASSANNTIGGTTASLRNVISGNNGDGIEISNAAGIGSATGNVVLGNYIGTNAAGTAALANGVDGIRLAVNGNSNTIGGTATGAGNVISGNSFVGVEIFNSTGNVLLGNFIGTNAAGSAAIPNASVGVYVLSSTSTTIGGTVTGARNVISGNTFHGIQLDGSTSGTVIQGNYIGLNKDGNVSIGIQDVGISINNQNAGSISNNTIGGTIAGARNVISGNELNGVQIQRFTVSAVSNNVVEGNYIGTDATGTLDLGNGQMGVALTGGVTNNRIGGTTAASRNVISGNQDSGVYITDNGTTGNLVQGNYIGLTAGGTAALANGNYGVRVTNSASSNSIGGTTAGAGNVISGNGTVGIELSINATSNLVQGNFIGTNATGTAAVSNSSLGVSVLNASNNTIGGTTATARNVISGNAAYGVQLSGTSTGNLVQGNYVGLNAAGTGSIGTQIHGVVLVDGPSGNTIGGTAIGAGNVISGNTQDGVHILRISTAVSSNIVEGNLIGTDPGGTLDLGNGGYGVRMSGGVTSNRIGGTTTASRNVISGNNAGGVVIESAGTTGNLVQGNYIGTTVSGTAALANTGNGVVIQTGAANNTIGGTAAGAGNLINFNSGDGVVITGGTGNAILGNSIGSNGQLGIDLGDDGVTLNDATDSDTGPNNLQNFPVLTSVVLTSTALTIQGTLTSTANTTFTVEFFTAGGDLSGHGEGQTFLSRINVTTNGSGVASFSTTLTVTTLFHAIIATATNQVTNDTSEFSAWMRPAYVVNSTGDQGDAAPGDGVALTAGGVTTLRAAIEETNTLSGSDTIFFNIAGAGVKTVALLSALPAITDALVIDGTTQPGYAGIPLIELNGTGAGIGANGLLLTLSGSGSTIKGLVINRFESAGIWLNNSSSNVITGNYIGTDPTGTLDLGNGFGMVLDIGASNNTIGGTTAALRNVISGNQADGILIRASGTTGNQIQGNFIGTTASGAAALENSANGIQLTNGAANNTIGGTTVGAGNTVAFNLQDGIALSSTAGTGNAIKANSIHSNGQLGIDLNNDGVTANDVLDTDTGPNNLQNVPVLTNVSPGSVIIAGTLNSEANKTYTLEFFSSPVGTLPADAEGRTFLGRTAVTTDGNGNASFSVTLPASVALGELVTATATDPTGNTSEFAAPVTVTNSIVSSAVLNVTTNGFGTGRITSVPYGIDTAVPVSGFTETYPLNTLVTLTATPTGSSTFAGWTGSGISSSNPVLTLTMDWVRTVTATFNPSGSTAVPPRVVDFVQGTSIFSRSLTITWKAPSVTPDAYLVYVGTQSGVYDPTPYFVYGNRTSLTLTKLTGPKYYFTVTAVYNLLAPPPEAIVVEPNAAPLEPQLAPVAAPDTYYVPVGARFQTTRELGVLANDTDPDGNRLTASLKLPQPLGGTVTLNADGSFLFTPNATFTSSTVFVYTVSDGTSTMDQSATITIAQESGRSQESAVTLLSGLDGWTVLDQGTVASPSSWAGTDPSYRQVSGIDTPGTGTAALGTLLYSTNGMAQGRTDYRLNVNLSSSADGALGVTFRYVDPGHYYRFSMERDPNGDGNPADGYRRLIKMVNGTPTILQQQLTSVAYERDVVYPVLIGVTNALINGVTTTTITVDLQDPQGGPSLTRWTVTDPQPFVSNGLALYSAGNAGSSYDVQLDSLENPTQVPLEVRTSGAGTGTVTGQVGTGSIILSSAGAPVASFASDAAAPTVVTLTASPGSGSTFTGWRDTAGTLLSTAPTLTVSMTQAKIITAQFDGVPAPAQTLDIDGNGLVEPLKDGLLILRYMFGFTGPALTTGLIGTGATRTNPTDMVSYLDQAKTTLLDVDANINGTTMPGPEPLKDGLVILRYLFGFRDANLTAGVVDTVNGRRTSAAAIQNFLALVDLNPATTPVPPAPGTGNTAASELLAQASGTLSTSSGQAGLGASSTEAASVSPLASRLAPDSESPAIAATQLSTTSSPWVSGFVTNGAAKEEDELVVTL